MIKGLPSVNFQNFLGKDWLNLFVGEGGELLLGDHQVAVVDVLDGATCLVIILMVTLMTNLLLVNHHQVALCRCRWATRR